jgi:hypothetical protein
MFAENFSEKVETADGVARFNTLSSNPDYGNRASLVQELS